VAEALGAVDAAAVSRIGAALVARDGAAVLAELDGLHERGLETKRVAEEIVRHLRNVVVTRLAPGAPLDLPDAELAEVRAQAEGADPAQLTRLFDVAQKAATEVKQAEQPRYALEVALLKGVFLAPGADVADLIGRLEEMAGGSAPPLPGGPGGGARPAAGAQRAAPATAQRTATSTPASPQPTTSMPAPPPVPSSTAASREVAKFGTPGCAAGSVPAPPRPERLPPPAATPEGDVQGGAAEAEVRDDPSAPPAARWRAAVERVERVSPLTAPALKQATLLWLRDGEVAIQLPPGIYATTAERRRAEIESTFARHFGRPTRLSVTLGAAAAGPAAGAEPVAPSLAAAEAAERQARASRARDAARSHPNIREAAKILEGGIDKIEEL
jgi:DNA polymerase-3 subunit gamma/tau